MTKEKLEAYKSMNAEIIELRERVMFLKNDDSIIKADTVLDYRTGQGIPKRIEGVDQKAYWRKRNRYVDRIKQLQKECDDIEDWVENISDSMTRRIFRLAYIDGVSFKEIGMMLNMDRSNVGKKIRAYISKDPVKK